MPKKLVIVNSLKNNEKVDDNQPPVGAIMNLLKKNTEQRDVANGLLKHTEAKVRNAKELHIATLGRLYKYEGKAIVKEALEYAKKEGMFIKCNSAVLGIKTTISTYKNKSGKVKPAHFTHYKHYLKPAESDDAEPEYYVGNFLYKDFADKLDVFLNDNVESFDDIEDLFNFDNFKME